MDTAPYQSTNNELVFVTRTESNVIQNKVSVQCNGKQLTITSVGVFDRVLHYGMKISQIGIKAHEDTHILFTAITEMNKRKVQFLKQFESSESRNMLGRKLLVKAILGGPELPLKLKFTKESNQNNVVSKVMALDEYNGAKEIKFETETVVSSKSDYVLHIGNNGNEEVEFELESKLVSLFDDDFLSRNFLAHENGLWGQNRKRMEDTIVDRESVEFELIESSSQKSGAKRGFDGAYYGTIGVCVILFGMLVVFVLKKITRGSGEHAYQQLIQGSSKDEDTFDCTIVTDDNYKLMSDAI